MLRRDDDIVIRVALDLKVSGKKKARTFEENREEASGGRDKEDWFEEGGCPELTKVERRNASNCRRNGVKTAIFAKRTIPDKKLNNYYLKSRFK